MKTKMALTSYHDDLERESEESEETSEDDSDESSRDERMGGQHGHGHGHGGAGGGRREHTEMREQMYQDKLAELKSQLAQLHSGQLVEYVKRMRKLEAQHRERQRVNDIIRDLEMEMVDREFFREKKAAAREFEEHKVYLREQLVQELEEKHKVIETERHNVELTGDSAELKTISTRKLRRRPNEQSSQCY